MRYTHNVLQQVGRSPSKITQRSFFSPIRYLRYGSLCLQFKASNVSVCSSAYFVLSEISSLSTHTFHCDLVRDQAFFRLMPSSTLLAPETAKLSYFLLPASYLLHSSYSCCQVCFRWAISSCRRCWSAISEFDFFAILGSCTRTIKKIT